MKKKTLKTLEYYKIINLLEEKAESDLGREKIKDLKPLKDKEKIEALLEETDEALRLIINRGTPPLYGIYSIKEELGRVRMGGTLYPASLLKISDSLRVSRTLKDYISESEQDRFSEYPIIEELINRLNINLGIENKINKAIVNDQEISDDASPKLKRLRREIVNKNSSIKSKLESIVNSSDKQKYLQDNIVTVRDGRYVIPVKQQSKKFVPGIMHDVSASGATAFIEPMSVVELNNELRDLEIAEREEIERILKELSENVNEYREELAVNEKVLQDVDFIFAKGKFALDMKATKPILNTRGYINLREARHPLLTDEEVVPIDIYIGDEFKTLVITGPNTGGKTVSLKTVGLATLMAQSGLHIPARDNSELAVFDQVFADIGDEQSIEQSLSTFSSHMTNIVDILESVEDNSLLLFDELGAGTDPTEGAAIAMSILDFLLEKNVRTMATTHYSQLKLYALTTENVLNGSVEFDVETLKPTYKLSIGVPGKSNAFEISQRLGLDMGIIGHARELISKENIEFEDVLQAIEEDRKEAEEKRYELGVLEREIKGLKEQLDDEKAKTEKMREQILQKAREEARDIVKNAKEESDLIVTELRELSKEGAKFDRKKMHEAQRYMRDVAAEADSQAREKVLDVKSNKIPKDLKIGETVEVLSLGQKGEVLSIPDDSKGEVQVQVGIMKVNVPMKSLRRTSSAAETQTQAKSRAYIDIKSKNIKNDIDLRGKNTEEAIIELDDYIDDVYIAGLKEVTIIHGKGTGALRDGLQPYFRNHKLIKSYRPGEFGEGGTGVTVINIK